MLHARPWPSTTLRATDYRAGPVPNPALHNPTENTMIMLGVAMAILSAMGQVLALSQLDTEHIFDRENIALLVYWAFMFGMGLVGLSLL